MVAFPLAYWSVIMFDLLILVHPLEIYWRMLIYATGSSIFFVLIGWKLFDRIDHLLDKKIAPDETEEGKKSNGKRRSKK